MSKTSFGNQFPELSVSHPTISPGLEDLQWWARVSHMEWEEPDHPASLLNNNFRCIAPGVGTHLQRNSDQRSMISSGANPSHQLFGTPCSHTGSTDIHQGEVRHHNSSQDRQHIHGGLHQQNGGGGDCINYAIASNQGSMVMVYGKEYPVTSTALTRSIEFHY